ncbi:helix-turn-helix domain-containing protein [Paenibacillus contaminans]|uniref:HTH araC/xylS-type domain-containing protein n=1 Tax=Paenibacillus contaminans TaxID=450362 RepID=A0A329MG38_9BACL|nr:helix-turn-helix domain-containing protein [Paenibacillus contaminans]RAV18911.1 hypothetical protein DQG23_22405 [Paenibacillus contaminans]
MLGIKLNYKLFYQYMISYIVVLLLPIIIIGLTVYSYFIQLLRDEVIRGNLNLLAQVKDTIDVKMNEFGNIAYHIASNPNLTPYAATKNAYSEMNAILELRNYSSANHLIHDMLLYYRGGEKLYSPYSAYDALTYTDKIFRYEAWKAEDFYKTIETIDKPLLRSAETVAMNSPERFITYLLPIPYRDVKPYGTAVFLIKEDAFRDMIKKSFGDYGGNTIILNGEGKLITSLSNIEESQLNELLLAMPMERQNGSQTVRLSRNDYIVSYIKSESLGWSYVSLVDKNKVMNSIQLAKQRTLFGLLFVLIVGSIVIYYVTSLNYKPIKRLKTLADRTLKQPQRNGNELESIQSAFRYISDNNDELIRKISSSKPALKNYLLLNLLKGDFQDVEEFNRRGEAADFRLTKRQLWVAIVYFSKKEQESGMHGDLIIKEVEGLLPEQIEGYGKENVEEGTLTFIFGTDEDSEQVIKTYLLRVQEHMLSEHGLQATVGVGNPYRNVGEIGKSYIEACSAIDYRLIKGHGQIIFFSEITLRSGTRDSWYPKSEWERLKLYIVRGNTEEVEFYLNQLIATMKGEQIPLYMAKCMCYDLINVIFAIMYELNLDLKNQQKSYPDVMTLTEFETVDELAELVRTISIDICGMIRDRKESGNVQLQDRMIAYIHEFYGSYHFSVQMMADDFQMSASYLSRYFKDQAGQTLTQYVNSVRMDKAKRLLREGNENLNEIVTQIGYGSVPGFIRKFKETEGLTPGEYRSLHRQ